MIKYSILWVIAVFGCYSCNQSGTAGKASDNVHSTGTVAVQVQPAMHGDANASVYQVSHYNESYLLKISPGMDSSGLHQDYHIVLTQSDDTIFQQPVTLTSFEQAIMTQEQYIDDTGFTTITSSYALRGVAYHGVRAYNLYFVADIASLKGKKDLKALFQLSYKGEPGQFRVNGVNEKGWGVSASPN